jgi:hypothetical protein
LYFNNQHEQLAAIEAHVGELKIKKLAPIFSSTQSICIDESQIDSELIELIIDVCKSGIDKYLARDGSHLAWYSFYLNNEHSKKRAKLFLKLFDANAQEPFIQLCALHVLIHNPHGRDTFTLKSDVFGEFKIFGNEQFTLEKFIQIIGRVIATMQKDNVMSNEKVLEIWKQIIQFVEKQDPDSFVLPDFSL